MIGPFFFGRSHACLVAGFKMVDVALDNDLLNALLAAEMVEEGSLLHVRAAADVVKRHVRRATLPDQRAIAFEHLLLRI